MRKPQAGSISESRHDLVLRGAGLVGLVLCCWAFLFAPAARAADLHVRFVPEPSGPGIIFDFGFTIAGKSPSPLTSVALRFPPGLSYATSALGMAECNSKRLTAMGLAGCPVNSRIGRGTATVRVPFGNGSLKETVDLTLLVGHTHGEAQEVLYYAVGTVPVISELVFRAEIGTAAAGNAMVTRIPAITTLPGSPNASVVSLDSRIDPPGLTYTRFSNHREVHYHPRGMILPSACPPRGYGFSATFRFENNTASNASSTVRCQRAG
ncbi:MAG: hypothetical protein QOF85_2232 [Solirubrobacterales bacterium]|jgi:hypothetical protein|nr:hypothetical protein [Solirubrobacterales bacterium]